MSSKRKLHVSTLSIWRKALRTFSPLPFPTQDSMVSDTGVAAILATILVIAIFFIRCVLLPPRTYDERGIRDEIHNARLESITAGPRSSRPRSPLETELGVISRPPPVYRPENPGGGVPVDTPPAPSARTAESRAERGRSLAPVSEGDKACVANERPPSYSSSPGTEAGARS